MSREHIWHGHHTNQGVPVRAWGISQIVGALRPLL